MWFRMLRRVLLIILAWVMMKNKVKIKDMHLAGMTRDNSSFWNQEKINENCVQAQGNFQLLHRLYCQQRTEGWGGGVGILLTCLILNNLSNVHIPLFAFRLPCFQFERTTSLIDFLSCGTRHFSKNIYFKTFGMQLVDDSSGIPLIVT